MLVKGKGVLLSHFSHVRLCATPEREGSGAEGKRGERNNTERSEMAKERLNLHSAL